MEEERKRLEEEKQRMEEEKKRLEAERKAEEEKKAEEERLKAEAEAEKKRQEEETKAKEEAEAKAKAEAEAKAKAEAEAAEAKKKEEERQKQEAEEKRLLTLRIKKVEGTEDDYTCIDGWTNFWKLCNTQNRLEIKCQIGSLMPPKIMDSNGVVKTSITEETVTDTSSKRKSVSAVKKDPDINYYPKIVAGCPVKTNEILTLQGMKPYNKNLDYFEDERVFFYDDKGENLYVSTRTDVFTQEMEAKDITNDPRTGWTNEENTKWKGKKPVIAMSYIVNYDVKDKVSSGYYKTNLNKEQSLSLHDQIVDDYVDKYFGFSPFYR